MPYLETQKNIKIYYNILNENSKKTPMVFVHGFINNWTVLKDEIKYYKKKNHPILYLDLRGHGKSTVPKEEEDFSIHKLVEDIQALVNHVKFKKINLVGYSLGGIVSLTYAIKYQSTLNRLIIINSAHEPPKNMLFSKLFIKHHYTKKLYELMLKNNKSKTIIEYDITTTRKKSNKYKYVLELILKSNLKTILLFADQLFNLNIKNISKITTPTLIIESTKDEFFSKQEQTSLHKEIKSSIIKFLPGGHDTVVTKSHIIIEEIDEFLALKPSFFKKK